MAVLNGNDFILTASNSSTGTKLQFAHTTSHTINMTNELREVTTENTGGWAEFIPIKKVSSVSFSGLQDYGSISNRHNTEDIIDFFLDNDTLFFQIGQGANILFGNGIIESMQLDGETDGVATYSGTMAVTNVLLRESAPPPGVVVVPLQDSSGNPILGSLGEPLTAVT